MTTEVVHDPADLRPLPRRLAAPLKPHHLALGLILALAACLDFWSLSQNGYANTYYSGAVRSMLRSWHNFFFVSFDPGGLVSVDKPPLALWVQAASAKAFGYSSFAILLPEALAGVGAVWILYLLVGRYFGRVAGLLAATCLAVSPVSVSVNRDNNPDALLALLLVASVYVGARAVESGRLRWLVGCALLVGLAFNTKMLAAMVVVPGLSLAYLLFAKLRWRTRLWHLLAAGAILVAVSGAWIAAVDLTDPASRPYVGSTTTNSALDLAFDYNGLGRVSGQTGGTSFGGGLGGAFSGTPGLFRLINTALGDQGGWLLPLAIVGGLSLLIAAFRLRRREELAFLVNVGGWFVAAATVFSYSSGIIHTYYLAALAPATCALVGAGTVSLWRDTRRGLHRAVLPLLAIALTAWLQIDILGRSDYQAWIRPLVIVTAAIAGALLVSVAAPRHLPGRAKALVSIGAVALAATGSLVAPAAWSASTLESPVNGVFPGAGPNFVSGLAAQGSGSFGGGPVRTFGQPPRGPGLGPAPGGGPRPGGPGGPGGGQFQAPSGGGFRPPTGGATGPGNDAAGSTDVSAALAYVKTHGAATRFGLIVSSEQEAAPFVVKGEPVAAMGGFTGRETVLTSSYLARLVRSGAARHFLLGAGIRLGPFSTANAASSMIQSVCREVPRSSWSSESATIFGSQSLYDCSGKADAIARSKT